MITLKEILGSVELSSIPKEHQDNILELLRIMNLIRAKRNQPMTITSGYRTKEHHLRVYRELAVQRKQTFDESKVPMGSAHLKGCAVDVSDPDGSLYQWTIDNEQFLAQVGVWMEEKDDQKRVHFQTYPPLSKKRWFKP